MVYKNNRSNIVHCGSNKCKRTGTSVLEAEMDAPLLELDYVFVVKRLLE